MKQIVMVAKRTEESPRKSEGDVIELKDGRLLLVYMEFVGQGSDFSTTRIVAAESSDGESWTRHRVLTETMPGDVNVYSPNLIRSSEGHILLIFMRKHTKEPTLATQYVWRSADEGESFSPYAEFLPREPYALCNGVVKRLKSGRLLLPLNAASERGPCGTVLYSDDDGRTWSESDNRVYLPMRGVMEPHVEQARDGRVLMVVRSQLGSLFMSESHDDGVTWSLLQPSGLVTPESCPELVRIPATGHLLMIWNNSPYDPAFTSHYGKRSPLTAAVSMDDGRTWSHFRHIEDDPQRAFTNPGCRFLSNGKAILNYWTCEYTSKWRMQEKIDLRVAVIDTQWFYCG